MAEVGASYAPWTCVGAVLAKRTGRKANLVAVEASSFLFDLIPVHLRENGDRAIGDQADQRCRRSSRRYSVLSESDQPW